MSILRRRSQTVALFFNPKKIQAKAAAVKVKSYLKSRGVALVKQASKECLFALVLGGDGSILRTAGKLADKNIPILGINLGRLGFLTATDTEHLYPILDLALQEKLDTEKRAMLEIIITSGKKNVKKIALNDCYIHAGTPSRTIDIEVSFNGAPVANYSGDGIIVATPTGSTAYSLAASGPIVYPTLPVLLLSPICPHTLTQRPLVLPDNGQLNLHLKPHEGQTKAVLSLDGQEQISLNSKQTLCIKTSKYKTLLLTAKDYDYFKILRNKLKWGWR